MMNATRAAPSTAKTVVGALATSIAPLLLVMVAVDAGVVLVLVLPPSVMVPVETKVVVMDPLVRMVEVTNVDVEFAKVTVVVPVVTEVMVVEMVTETGTVVVEVETGRTVTLPLDSVTVVDAGGADTDVVETVVAVAVPVNDDEKSLGETLNEWLVEYVWVEFDPDPTSAIEYEPDDVEGRGIVRDPFLGVMPLSSVVDVPLLLNRSMSYEAGASGQA